MLHNKKRSIVISAVLIGIFAVCTVFAVTGKYDSVEMKLYYALQSDSSFVYGIMRGFSYLGDTLFVIILCVALMLVTRLSKKYAIPTVASVIIGFGLNNLIKVIIQRPRPIIENCKLDETTFSFPSGHAMSNISFYAALALCVLLYCNSKKIKKIFVPILFAIPVIMGISRIYFGVHYFSDIISGWSLGILTAYWVVKIYDRYIIDKIKFEKIGVKTNAK